MVRHKCGNITDDLYCLCYMCTTGLCGCHRLQNRERSSRVGCFCTFAAILLVLVVVFLRAVGIEV